MLLWNCQALLWVLEHHQCRYGERVERVRRCAAALRHVRAVTATYRMTTRPPPSRPSHYAAGILTPLRAFLDAPHGRALPAATRASLAQV